MFRIWESYYRQYGLMTSDKTLTRLSSGKDRLDSEISTGTITVDPKLKKPPLYRVILLNDDYTPMEFVVYILQSFFNMNQEKATQVMLAVHQHGKGVCGIFTKDVAETKVFTVLKMAKCDQHPLKCIMEPE